VTLQIEEPPGQAAPQQNPQAEVDTQRLAVAAAWRELHSWRRKRLDLFRRSDVYSSLPENARRVAEYMIGKHESPQLGAFPNQQKIADALGLSRQAVNRHLRALVDAGVLTSEVRIRAARGRWERASNRYRLCVTRLKAIVRTVRRTASKLPWYADNCPSRKADISDPPAPPPGSPESWGPKPDRFRLWDELNKTPGDVERRYGAAEAAEYAAFLAEQEEEADTMNTDAEYKRSEIREGIEVWRYEAIEYERGFVSEAVVRALAVAFMRSGAQTFSSIAQIARLAGVDLRTAVETIDHLSDTGYLLARPRSLLATLPDSEPDSVPAWAPREVRNAKLGLHDEEGDHFEYRLGEKPPGGTPDE
jgi:DNA-binding transcriptional ArsR family regulator